MHAMTLRLSTLSFKHMLIGLALTIASPAALLFALSPGLNVAAVLVFFFIALIGGLYLTFRWATKPCWISLDKETLSVDGHTIPLSAIRGVHSFIGEGFMDGISLVADGNKRVHLTGWNFGQEKGKIAALYAALVANRDPNLPPIKLMTYGEVNQEFARARSPLVTVLIIAAVGFNLFLLYELMTGQLDPKPRLWAIWIIGDLVIAFKILSLSRLMR